MSTGGLVRKTCLVKRSIQPLATAVTREHSAGAIGTMCCRCQSNDEQSAITRLRLHRKQIWNRTPPIIIIHKLAFFSHGPRSGTIRANGGSVHRSQSVDSDFPEAQPSESITCSFQFQPMPRNNRRQSPRREPSWPSMIHDEPVHRQFPISPRLWPGPQPRSIIQYPSQVHVVP